MTENAEKLTQEGKALTLRNLGMDSLTAVRLVSQLKDQYQGTQPHPTHTRTHTHDTHHRTRTHIIVRHSRRAVSNPVEMSVQALFQENLTVADLAEMMTKGATSEAPPELAVDWAKECALGTVLRVCRVACCVSCACRVLLTWQLVDRPGDQA
jgi:hypothetical protein